MLCQKTHRKRLLMSSIYGVLSYSFSFSDGLRNLLQRGINKEIVKQALTGIKRHYMCARFAREHCLKCGYTSRTQLSSSLRETSIAFRKGSDTRENNLKKSNGIHVFWLLQGCVAVMKIDL